MQRAERIHCQRLRDMHELYALDAPEDECTSKGNAHQPYEFSVKVGSAVTQQHGLMVRARSISGNKYNGHMLAA